MTLVSSSSACSRRASAVVNRRYLRSFSSERILRCLRASRSVERSCARMVFCAAICASVSRTPRRRRMSQCRPNRKRIHHRPLHRPRRGRRCERTHRRRHPRRPRRPHLVRSLWSLMRCSNVSCLCWRRRISLSRWETMRFCSSSRCRRSRRSVSKRNVYLLAIGFPLFPSPTPRGGGAPAISVSSYFRLPPPQRGGAKGRAQTLFIVSSCLVAVLPRTCRFAIPAWRRSCLSVRRGPVAHGERIGNPRFRRSADSRTFRWRAASE